MSLSFGKLISLSKRKTHLSDTETAEARERYSKFVSACEAVIMLSLLTREEVLQTAAVDAPPVF